MTQEQTSYAGLDITSIELRLKAALQEKESYSGIGSDVLNDWPTIMDADYDFVTAPLAQELFDHAPTDIAALLGEVKRLRREVNEMARAGYDFDVWETGRATREFTPPYPDEKE